jgi:predicted Zn-dependent peptidase
VAAQRLAAAGVSAAVSVDFRVIHTNRFGSPAAINLVVRAATDAELPAVERGLLAAIDDLRAGRIDAGALASARKRLRLEWAEFLNSPQELAFLIGHYHTMDNWRTLPALVEARNAATVEDIQRVAGPTSCRPTVTAVARTQPPEGSGPSWLDFAWSDLRGSAQ